MAFQFPNNPQVNDIVDFGGLKYLFNGKAWEAISSHNTNLQNIYKGEGVPNDAVGKDGDFYFDVLNHRLYGPKGNESWAQSALYRGVYSHITEGEPEPELGEIKDLAFDVTSHRLYTKTAGGWQSLGLYRGTKVFTGHEAPPESVGEIDDIFLDISSHKLYGPKTESGWGSPLIYRGTRIFDGPEDPLPTLGEDGDYFINTSNYFMFGPKTEGDWGVAFPLRGNDFHTGYGAPQNYIGKDGDLYVDQTFNTIYGPKASGQWPLTPRGFRIYDTVMDHGDVSGEVQIDLRYGIHKLNATGNVTIVFTNPPSYGFRGVVTLEMTRASSSGATVTWPENISFNSVVIPTLVDSLTTIVSASTTTSGLSYFGYGNAVSYEITASGNATSWNPSDKNAALGIYDDGKTIGQISTHNTAGAGILSVAGRAFGGKTTGKHKLVLVCKRDMTASSTTNSGQGHAEVRLGVATLGQSLDSTLTAPAYYLAIQRGDFSTSGDAISQRSNINGTTITPITPVANTTLIHLLFDFDAGRMWVAVNGVIIGGGDPEAGLGANVSSIMPSTYFPAVGVYCSNPTAATNFFAGRWKLMNEVEDPYYQQWTSFQNWSL